MKKRIGSLLMALCLCLSLLPTAALAATEESIIASVSKQAVMLGTGSPLGYDAKAGTYGSYDKLYFGTYYADMTNESATGTPHAWRILDGQTNTEEGGLFLLSMPTYEGVRFTLARTDEDNTEWWKEPHNVWTSVLCAARAWCGTLAASNKIFTDAERAAIPAVTKDSERYNPTSSSYFTSQYGNVQTGALKDDKIFYLSAKEFEDARYGLTDADTSANYALRTGVDGFYVTDEQTINDGLIATTVNIKGHYMLSTLRIYSKWFTGTAYSQELTATEKFFLGSASDFGFLPSLLLPSEATEQYEYVYNELSARPAMNLSGDKLLYLTRVDNGGHTVFGKVADASTNWEWKATVRNSSDTTFKSGVTLNDLPTDSVFTEGSRTVTITHPALSSLTGYNTITAALINASGEVVCYGSIRTDAKDEDKTATSTDLTIADGLVVDGTYTLRITAEQWNDAKQTDLAAEPFDTTITVANAHNHLVCGSESYCYDGHTAVAWTPVSTPAELAAMTADGYYFLTGDVAAPETACVGHLCVNGNTVTGTLIAGDGLTLCDCADYKDKKSISAVSVAAGGTYTQYELSVSCLSAGDNSTLNIRGNGLNIDQENDTLQLGEGTKLNIYSGFVRRTGNSDTPALPKNCEIHMYGGILYIPLSITNADSKLCLYGGKTWNPITLGASGSLTMDPSDLCTITSLCMESGSTVTVPEKATVETVTNMAANSTLTVENGGTLKKVESAVADSTLHFYGGTAETIVSDGTVNLYGAVNGATFTVTKPLNICANLGTKAATACTVDIMDKNDNPKVTDGVFTSGWSTHMSDATISDYFKTPTAYEITKNNDGELVCQKRNHEVNNHPACGATCGHTSGTHSSVDWTGISEWNDNSTSTTLSEGNYLLETDVTRAGTGGTVTISGTVNICLNGYTLDLNGGCFEVGSGATLNICDCAGTGKVTGGTGATGGAVYVNGGTFNLYSGELAGNAASENNNCAVYMSSGTFTMAGGAITGSDGVEVAGGQFNMTGGTISSVKYGYVAVWMSGGNANMTGGTINTKYAPMNLSGGTFTLSDGGSIVTSKYDPVTVSGGTLQINGGSIVSQDGTAVTLTDSGTVTMTGGTVKGDGTVTIKGGKFTMSGGSIAPYTDEENCWWGVKLETNSTGTFTMTGGTISGFDSSGVEVMGGTMTVSGTAKITGNTNTINQPTSYHPARNVYLASGQKITVGELSSSAQIGITMEAKTGTFSSGGSGYSTYFTSDDGDYSVAPDGENLQLTGNSTTPTLTKLLVDGKEVTKIESDKYSEGYYYPVTLEVGQSVELSVEFSQEGVDYILGGRYFATIADNRILTGVSVAVGDVAVYYKNEVIVQIYVTVTKASSYTVTYDMQGHGDATTVKVDPGAKLMEPTDPTDTNYRFISWYKDAACTTAWNFSTDTVTANTTLYAKWTAKGYAMTLNANGGTCPNDPDTGKPIDSVLLIYGQACSSLPTPTRSGYTFEGWVDSAGDTFTADTVLNKAFPETAAGRTLTAQWTAIPATPPTVTPDNNLTLTYGYTGDHSISVTAPAVEGHTLSYQWYTCDADGANASEIENATSSSFPIETGMNAGKTYYYCIVTATRGDNNQTATANSSVITVTVEKADPGEPTNLTGYAGHALSSVSLPDGWSWVNGDATVLSTAQSAYAAKYTDSTGNYNNVESRDLTVTVSAKTQQPLTVTMENWTYGDADKNPVYTAPEGTTVTITYIGRDNTNYTENTTVPADAGDYTVTVSYETKTEIYTGTADFTIAKADLTSVSVSQTGTLTYTGTAQIAQATATATAANDQSVTFTYSNAVDGTYTEAVPGFADVGEHTVYYKASAANHNDASGSFTMTIAKATPTITGATATVTYGDVPAGDSITATTGGIAGSFEWKDVTSYGDATNGTPKTLTATFTPNDTTNYNSVDVDVSVTVSKAVYDNKTASGSAKYGGSGEVDLTNLIADDGTATLETATDDNGILSGTESVTDNKLSFAFVNSRDKVGRIATIPVKVTSTNYSDYTITVTVTVTDKTAQTLTVSMTGWTYGGTENAPGYSNTGMIEATLSVKYEGRNGTTYTESATVPTDAGDYTVRVSYETSTEIWSGTANFTIAKATPTGAPKYTPITENGKTLADAALTTTDSTFSVEGSVKWVDENDAELVNTTAVTANAAYQWLFTPTNTNYTTLTGSVVLYTVATPSGGSGGSSTTTTTITVPVSSDNASVEVKAEVSQGNATVEVSDAQIEQVANDGAGEVTIDVSGLNNVTSATIPAHVVEKTNAAENTGLTVALPSGSVTLDETALESVTENVGGEDVTISVVSIPTENLLPVVKEIIGMEPTVAAVVDVNVAVNGAKQSTFNGGKVTISIPYTPKPGEDTSKLTVWFIRDDGTIENKGGYYDAAKGCFVFETEHLSQYLLVNAPVTFDDVSANAWYAAAVSWAAQQNITGGVGNNQFAPDLSCSRAQLVTFLWRAAGCPVADYETSFSDVKDDQWYTEAVRWAASLGIVQGYGNGQFGSEDTITREQMATILYRYAVATGADVSVGADTNILSYNDAFEVSEFAVEALQWAVGAGIVQGDGANLMPKADCTRAQIVTMLYRLLGK